MDSWEILMLLHIVPTHSIQSHGNSRGNTHFLSSQNHSLVLWINLEHNRVRVLWEYMVVQTCRARYTADLGFIENYYFEFISIRRKYRLKGEKKNTVKKNIKHYGGKKKKKHCSSAGLLESLWPKSWSLNWDLLRGSSANRTVNKPSYSSKFFFFFLTEKKS